MKSGKITAIIPAKGMSGRLYRKNLLPYADSNLLVNKMRQLKKCEAIDEIIVSSEDEEILELARKENVVALQRPYEYSVETKPFQEFLYYIVNLANCEHVMWACCTSPLVDSNIYNKACLEYFRKLNEGYDSLITVMEYRHYLLDGNMKPLTFKWGPDHRNSQDLDRYYFFTDGIQMAPKKSMLEWKYYFGHNPFGFEVDLRTSTDIDTVYDYLLARMQFHCCPEELDSKGISINDGKRLYSYLIGKMIDDVNEEEIKKILKSISSETKAILRGLLNQDE